MLEKLGIISKNSFIDPSDQSSHHKSFIKTGSQDLDNLFGGNGIETKAITQFYGQSATGKTQLCHTLCVPVQELKAEYKSIYVDTENTFRAERIRQIAEIKNLNPLEALRHVICFQPINSARLESVLQQNCSRLLNQDKDIELLIVDSIINHYRAEYSGRSMLSRRQSRLSRMMHFLQKIATMYDIAVVLTNHVQTAVDGYRNCLDEFEKPLGGNLMSHMSTFRIQLRGDPSFVLAKLVSSPCYPVATTSFEIFEGGIKDRAHQHHNVDF